MLETKLSYNPDFEIHPGESLNDELEFLNLTQVELAQRTGLSEKHISQIINGLEPITPETAIKLERAIGTAAEFWNNLQKNFELNRAQIAANKKIRYEIEEAKKFKCYSELAEMGCVRVTPDWNERAEDLLKFFAVDSLSFIKETEKTAFRQTPGRFDRYALAAWLRCGEIEAGKLKLEEFNSRVVRDIIPSIKKLTLNPRGFGEELRELCASAGVAVVYTPYFQNTKVNGSARWIGDRAVIQVNTRGAYSDIFWFTFFHELGHIMLHGVKEKFLDYKDKTIDEKEKEANSFAASTLIPETEYRSLIKVRPLNYQIVKSFAQKIGIGTDIVLGRLGHDKIAQWKQIARSRDRLVIQP